MLELRSGRSKFTIIRTVPGADGSLSWATNQKRRWGWKLERMRLLGSGSLLWLFLVHPRRNESCVLLPNTQMQLIP